MSRRLLAGVSGAAQTKKEYDDLNDALVRHLPNGVAEWEEQYCKWYENDGWKYPGRFVCPFSDSVERTSRTSLPAPSTSRPLAY